MRRTPCGSLTILVTLIASLLLPEVFPLHAQADAICFSETQQCISGRIRQFWEQNGGLAVFGYPIRAQQPQWVEGKQYQVQWFQRHRLELHPENSWPYDVQLGLNGTARLKQRNTLWESFPKGTHQANCLFFAETEHSLCGSFLAAWRANGLEVDGQSGLGMQDNLALFGLPISEPRSEQIEGLNYTVQWFQRARFEQHNQGVLFGLLSNEIAAHYGNPNTIPIPPGGPPSCADSDAGGDGPQFFTLIQPKEVATRFSLCFAGFALNQPISVEITRPNGIVQNHIITMTSESIGDLSYAVLPGDPVGLYMVSASQGTAQARGSFPVSAPTKPRLLVIPQSGPPGTVFQVALAGFDPVSLVPLHLYRNIAEYIPPPYLQQMIVEVSTQGTAISEWETIDFQPAIYLLDPGTLEEFAGLNDSRVFIITGP